MDVCFIKNFIIVLIDTVPVFLNANNVMHWDKKYIMKKYANSALYVMDRDILFDFLLFKSYLLYKFKILV